jgi:hypothetical protein
MAGCLLTAAAALHLILFPCGPHIRAVGVAPLGDKTLAAGRDLLSWDGRPGSLSAGETGCDRFYGPVSSPDLETVAVWAGSDRGDRIVLVRRDGVELLGPYARAGLPCWDAMGNLWFTAREELLRNGEPFGLNLDAHHISVSPDGGTVAFTDGGDRLLTMDLSTGAVDTVSSSFRYFGPFFTEGGDLVSPTLDGGIRLLRGGENRLVDWGDHPAWWPEMDGIVYIRTTDDGLRLTSSDLWLWTESSGARMLADTPYILEVNPVPCGNGVYFIDDFSGMVGFRIIP